VEFAVAALENTLSSRGHTFEAGSGLNAAKKALIA
jgi:hypothetical protein